MKKRTQTTEKKIPARYYKVRTIATYDSSPCYLPDSEADAFFKDVEDESFSRKNISSPDSTNNHSHT